MAYVWQDWMADEFRAAGLKVVEVQGWKRRGRPASTGHFNPKGANTVHHTGVTSSSSNPAPGLSTLISGRSDLPGPLCHYAVAYDGTVYVIAAGRANHAGRISKSGVPGMPYGGDGNAHAMGNEVMTNGTQTMPAAQRESIALTSAVVVLHWSRNQTWAHRHQDISATGKWDIGQWTTAFLRSRVADSIRKINTPATLPNRVKRARKELKTEIKRIRKAKRVARRKGENLRRYNGAIKALKNARKRLRKVPKRKK